MGTLRRAFVLSALPAWLERAAVSLSPASGVALLLVVLTAAVPGREREAEPDGDARREALV